ncbi:MAG: hypothetical protein AAF354_13390 [Pseudomonadota bacterium]
MARKRVGGPGNTRIVFSVLWIALGCLSAFYLFTLLTGPTAAEGQMAKATPPPANAEPAPAPTPEVPAANAAQLGAIEGTLQQLSQQLASLDERLRPIENFIGPAAKLPPSNSVSTKHGHT